MQSRTVLIASDSFKGSITSAGVAQAVAGGISEARPGTRMREVPIADGGEGTLSAVAAAGFTLVPLTGSGPTGEPVESGYARRGDQAVVELADVCGLGRLPDQERAPVTASSRGLGEVLAAAVDAGCRELVVGIGGSASTDGGAGMLQALGARLLDSAGAEIEAGGEGLPDLARIDLDPARSRLAGVRITVASDVDNPLTGPQGAASVYAPQKGATPAQVAALDRALAHLADVTAVETGHDLRDEAGAGAAGGVGFALLTLGAELRPGIGLILELTGFDDHLDGADLVITGEGALDEQTLHGKAPAGVAAAAYRAGVPVVAVCGVNRLTGAQLARAGIAAAYALVDAEPDVRRCLAEPAPILRELGRRIAREQLTGRL